ncbi:FAD-binding oxidoreductase [uncultured Thiodictyon sp.]|uniref:FAD-binding oxidoreductase n=1 Tax=uncultured Thiodictyon sp. TaxID=1846217 RepID=UPI0025CFAF23|nr:FAD-binding oxidoreductase [uncultured Thiodictyon sp.]
MNRHESWGRYPQATPALVTRLTDRRAPLPPSDHPRLVYGNGRSYGDVCLNDGGEVLLARGLDRFIAFGAATGVLRAEAGVLLSEVLDLAVPRGWFLAVTPGTRFVTLGGAVANDVHGKNHHRAGTFGCHVRALELVRSDGSRRECSPTQSPDWFAATIGGLGLTGLIAWVEIQLSRIPGPWLHAESRRFSALAEFFPLSEAADRRDEFTVAWVDCAARGANLGRGILLKGSFAPVAAGRGTPPKAHGRLSVPVTPPFSLINRLTLDAFNALYYRKPEDAGLTHYAPFFYPLDGIGHWNRIYGPKGFLQYQCVLPPAVAEPALRELLARIARSGEGSFLAVLKRFGGRVSPGLLSFPRPGVTIALDFPFKGQATLRLLDTLDAVVAAAGGALYPAKDARMGPAMFRRSFPALERFMTFVDRGFSSGFWRRATL